MYAKEEPGVTKQLKELIDRAKTSIVGVEMPDFAQNGVDDKPITLKSLRGKVVLIDFWASWCGPCRRENPNVVATYNKYKEKGFEILSVSLDSDKERWLGAIQQDGLLWKNHVCDLRGWKNEVAGQYGVSSIPQTLLIDKEGKLIARNLRGEQLGEALKQLLGE
jgi:thiol-disulfide isomerase/thioredoxin